MSLNYRQFGILGSRKPDPTVVTERRKALTGTSQSTLHQDTPDSELWEMLKNRSLRDAAEQELKFRNLL